MERSGRGRAEKRGRAKGRDNRRRSVELGGE
jgi:hypothetical protein